MSEAKIKAIAPWFGSNRLNAHEVGAELAGLKWVGVPFAGSMCEIFEISAPAIVVCDLHKHLINMARIIAHPTKGPRLYRRLRRKLFHSDEHADHQAIAKQSEPSGDEDIDAAEAYFVAVWMGRSHIAGVDDEFCGKLPARWNGNGGDSCKRYRSAVRSILAWRRAMERCNFRVMDALQFIERCEDNAKNGIYADPPFPGPGDRYKHPFPEPKQRELAKLLNGFKKTRVVCRYYDHPLVRELYPESHWTWRRFTGRDQANNGVKPEVLLINGPSLVEKPSPVAACF